MKWILTGTVIVLFWTACALAQTEAKAGIEILTDTQGVDFGPYLQQAVHNIKQNWYALIPESAMPPLLKRGRVAIEFAITKNGQIAGLHFVNSSGDVALDRAAHRGIMASNPFSPLPSEFTGPYLGLRMTFRYNPSLTGILPSIVKVRAGSSLQFSPLLKRVSDATQFPITWSVVGCRAGAACGTISQTGMYMAPSTVPQDPTLIVEAKADADVDETVSAIVTILPPEPSR